MWPHSSGAISIFHTDNYDSGICKTIAPKNIVGVLSCHDHHATTVDMHDAGQGTVHICRSMNEQINIVTVDTLNDFRKTGNACKLRHICQ